MLGSSRDVLVNYGSARKSGYYEISLDGRILARRVELPVWLDSFDPKVSGSLLIALQKELITIPSQHTHERQGHIFFRADPCGLTGSAVGIDLEVFKSYINSDHLVQISFVVFKFGKKAFERWIISWDDFTRCCKEVRTSASFAPQMMVSLSTLKRG